MSKSQILKDLVGGEERLESVLMRLKVILADLENEEINKWINSEIQGYETVNDVPPYRVLKGRPIGTYMLGNLKHTNASIPLNHISTELREQMLTINITDGALGIKSLLDSTSEVGRPVPAEVCQRLSHVGFYLSGMRIEVSPNQLQGIVANIKNKVTNIIMKLEKDFGNLDSLDVFSGEGSPKELESIQQYIISVIYDNSITIGDENKIKTSNVGHKGEV
ncbi:hypothetical protein GCM10008983_28050 [Lentibacillus halophilus]|uniref:AbiTii domain-containing protein n=1 Tax=Lentibacillus halophilus TaxID=295065 RepID=A0ABP3JBU1_9BACI